MGFAGTAAQADDLIGQYRDAGVNLLISSAYGNDAETYQTDSPYIAINDLPKVKALKQIFPDAFRDDPVLVAASR